MNPKDLKQLIKKGESQNLEFKDAKIKPATLAKSLVAFANTNAGKIIVGIDDKTRQPTDIQNREEVLDNIHRAASLDCCSPTVSISVEEHSLDNQPIFIVTVPYQYESVFSTEGRILKRRGTENVTASGSEILALSSKRGKLAYERQTIDKATLNDLDFTKINRYRQVYKEHRGRQLTIPDLQLLENLGSIQKEGDEYKPTVAGLLCFGKFPQRFLPQNYLTIVRYPKKQPTNTHLDSRQIEGTLPEIIDEAIQYISTHIQVASIKDLKRFGAQRRDIPEYPFPAIRELIINAIAHREYAVIGQRVIIKWYSDRIEISNPGVFVEPITAANIYTSLPAHRNPNIMKILYGFGYVEGYGEGMHLIAEQFENHPLSPRLPNFKEIPGGVEVTNYAADLSHLEITNEEWTKLGLNARQIKALEYIQENGKITNREYRILCATSRDTAHRDLSELVQKGILKREGKGRVTHYLMII